MWFQWLALSPQNQLWEEGQSHADLCIMAVMMMEHSGIRPTLPKFRGVQNLEVNLLADVIKINGQHLLALFTFSLFLECICFSLWGDSTLSSSFMGWGSDMCLRTEWDRRKVGVASRKCQIASGHPVGHTKLAIILKSELGKVTSLTARILQPAWPVAFPFSDFPRTAATLSHVQQYLQITV